MGKVFSDVDDVFLTCASHIIITSPYHYMVKPYHYNHLCKPNYEERAQHRLCQEQECDCGQ